MVKFHLSTSPNAEVTPNIDAIQADITVQVRYNHNLHGIIIAVTTLAWEKTPSVNPVEVDENKALLLEAGNMCV